jgi:RNA polymerase sigma factor (sigma-70 family)
VKQIDPMDIAELKAELEKHHRASFAWALSCCARDRADAEDVLQTVYLKILEGKARYRGEASFKTWLFAVIRKTAAGEHRKRLLRGLMANSVRHQRTTTEASVAIYERSEMQARFRRALERLPARQRQVLHLVFYEDLSLREAAEVMCISIGASRQHYERGKKRLRELLDKSELAYGINFHGKQNPSAV